MEKDLTLEERRENFELAEDAIVDIKMLTSKFEEAMQATIKILEDKTNQGIFDGDWEANLECLEDTLTSRIYKQFDCM